MSFTIANAVKASREIRGFTQSDFCEKTGFSLSEIQNIESGMFSIYDDHFIRFCKVFQVFYGVDLMTYTLAVSGDVTKLPIGVRGAAAAFIDQLRERFQKAGLMR